MKDLQIIRNIAAVLEKTHEELSRFNLKEKNVVVLLGPSGAGKTTAIHYFAGHNLIRKDGQIVLEENSQEERFVISGRAKSETKTLMPLEINFKNENYTFIDVPGFVDTDGAETELYNMICLHYAISMCSKLIPVLVFPQALVQTGTLRGELLRSLLTTVGSLIPIRNLQQSLVVLLTHAPDDYSTNQFKHD